MQFEDLDVWKRAARLSADIYIQLRDLKDFGFKKRCEDFKEIKYRATLQKVLKGNLKKKI